MPLANLPVKTDANGYLLVTMNGGTATPDVIKLDGTNRDIVFWRPSTKTLQIDTDGAGGALTDIFLTGRVQVSGNLFISAANTIIWGGGSKTALFPGSGAGTDGLLTVSNAAATAGFNLDATTDGTAWVKTRANADTATLKANTFAATGKFTTYNNVATAGQGLPSIYAESRVNAQVTAATTAASYTVGAADESLLLWGNVLISTHGSETFNLVYDYTDESNTARTAAVMALANTAGSMVIACSTAGPFAAHAFQIRAKSGTTVAIRTTGTFTGGTYNVEGGVAKVA